MTSSVGSATREGRKSRCPIESKSKPSRSARAAVGTSSPTSIDRPAPTAAACCSFTAADSSKATVDNSRGYGIALGRAGYTSLACEYRLAGEALWPAAIDDAQTAFDFFHGKRSRSVWPTRSWRRPATRPAAAFRCSWPARVRFPSPPSIAFYAPVDFLATTPGPTVHPKGMKYLLGDDVSEERLRDMSPINYVGPNVPADACS